MLYFYIVDDTGKINIASEKTSSVITLPKTEYDILLTENSTLKADVIYYKYELDKLRRMIFGQKSERFVPGEATDGQLTLGLETEPLPTQEPEKESITYVRTKPQKDEKSIPVRVPLPAHLPRVEEIIEPEEDITGAKKIGENITEILEYIPGKLYVRKIIRPKYLLPADEKIVTGILPTLPLPKSNAGASLLSHLAVSKFVDHLPFFRQIRQLARQDVVIPESTINDWFSAICRLLDPLYKRIPILVLKSGYAMADESPIKVLDSEKKGATHQGYQWVYYNPIDKIVYFEYKQGRGRDGPTRFLKDFQGSLQTDGYSVYDIFGQGQDIILLACMAHARRKFDQALNSDYARATEFMTMIQALYSIEREARLLGMNADQRKTYRQENAVPKLAEMEAWLKEKILVVLPKSPIGIAVSYTLRLWPRLIRYVEDGRYEIDNNLIENSIRPLALGRKNYLFAGSHQAAQRAAMMYSFFGTCKLNNVEPLKWLTHVLNLIPDCKMSQLDSLLPQNLKL
jgi:transposase